MKIKDVLCTILISTFCMAFSILFMLLFLGCIVAIFAAPVYWVCLLFGIKFSWAYAAALAGTAIIAYGVISSL